MSEKRHSIPIYNMGVQPRPAERETRHAVEKTETVRTRGGQDE